MDDFRQGREISQKADGDGRDVEPKKIGWFASLATWKQVGIVAGGVLALFVIAIGSGEEEQNSSGPSLERVQPDGSIGCPRQLFVGFPTEVTLALKNPGPVYYPSTFVFLDEGFDSFTLNEIYSGNESSKEADIPGFDPTYRFDQDVKPKGSRRVTLTLTPIEAGNRTLKVWAWAAPLDDRSVPSDPAIFECSDIPINP
ncbi:MAG: hypothetical protein WD181_01845 [Solirubrobacterales bacterium]